MKRRIDEPPSPTNDPRFQVERASFALVVGCERCAYFNVLEGVCAHGYPNERHRAAAFDVGSPVAASFCKEFELA